jgi:regulator of sirC expression with transglutaminase-like and TPR domain
LRRSSGGRRSRRRESITPPAADLLREFRELVARPETEVDLGRAALAIARIEYPDIAAASYLARLDDLATRSGASREGDARSKLDRLREFLFAAEGFRGNAEAYYDPRNSFLNDVLERRLGIPITLSLVMMEVGRRVGLPIAGIGLPGHFVVGARVGGESVVVDPFGGGRILRREDAEALVSRAVRRPVNLTDAHFVQASRTQIVVRLLENLKGIYAKHEDWAKTLAVLDRLLVVDPGDPAHARERGVVFAHLRRTLARLN